MVMILVEMIRCHVDFAITTATAGSETVDSDVGSGGGVEGGRGIIDDDAFYRFITLSFQTIIL